MHTKDTISFDEWYQELYRELTERGHAKTPDRDTAKEDYDVGMTVDASAESFEDEWASSSVNTESGEGDDFEEDDEDTPHLPEYEGPFWPER